MVRLGSTISLIPSHPQKAPFSTLALSGKFTEDNFLQSSYLEAIDYQLFAVYTVEKWIGVCLKGWG